MTHATRTARRLILALSLTMLASLAGCFVEPIIYADDVDDFLQRTGREVTSLVAEKRTIEYVDGGVEAPLIVEYSSGEWPIDAVEQMAEVFARELSAQGTFKLSRNPTLLYPGLQSWVFPGLSVYRNPVGSGLAGENWIFVLAVVR